MAINNVYFVSSHYSENISQITGIVRDYVISFFPRGFFRSVICNNEDVAVEDDYQATNRNIGKYTRKLPALAIKATYTQEPTIQENPVHDPWMDIYRRNGLLKEFYRHYHIIYKDHESEHFIGALPKRHQVTLDFSLRLESEPQLWDVMGYLRHSIHPEYWFYIKEFMQATIPNHIVYFIAKEYGYDMTLEDDREKLLKQLQKFSTNHITEILNRQTGERLYTHNFFQNILIKFNQPSADVNRKNFSVAYGDLKFSAVAQLMYYTNWAVNCQADKQTFGKLVDEIDGIKDDAPRFTYTIRKYLPVEQLADGKQLIFSKGFVCDAPNTLGSIRPQLDKPIYVLNGKKEVQYYMLPNSDLSVPKTSGLDIKFRGKLKSEYDCLMDGWKINLSSPDAAINLLLNDVFLGQRGSAFIVEIVAQCNHAGTVFAVNTVEQKATFQFDAEDYLQKFQIKLFVKNKSNRLVIKWANTNTNAEHRVEDLSIVIQSITIYPLIAEIQSTTTSDIIYLQSILPKDTLRVLRRDLELNRDPSEFFKFTFAQKNVRYLKDEEVKVNWKDLIITLRNPAFNKTHYINLYADKAHYNEVLFGDLYRVENRPFIHDYKHLDREHPDYINRSQNPHEEK